MAHILINMNADNCTDSSTTITKTLAELKPADVLSYHTRNLSIISKIELECKKNGHLCEVLHDGKIIKNADIVERLKVRG